MREDNKKTTKRMVSIDPVSACQPHMRKSCFNWMDYMANTSADASLNDSSPGSASVPTTTNEFRLVWLDMEMTGLDPEKERIIEVAIVITEPDLTVVAEGPVLVIHQPDAILDAMDSWNRGTHGKSGLIDKVRASTTTEEQAQDELIAFMLKYVPAGKSPLCGNTVSQDRRFMFKYMPRLEQFFHYRTIDVSTIKELARRWNPALLKGFEKHSKHEALADIMESIEELKYYREHFIKV